MNKNVSIEIPQQAIEALIDILRPVIAETVRQSISAYTDNEGPSPVLQSSPELPSSWMSVNEAAVYMRRHPKTILKFLADEQAKQGSGLVGYQKTAPNGVWRIHRDDVDAWMRDERPKKSTGRRRSK